MECIFIPFLYLFSYEIIFFSLWARTFGVTADHSLVGDRMVCWPFLQFNLLPFLPKPASSSWTFKQNNFFAGFPRDTSISANVSSNAAALGETVAILCSSQGYPKPVCRIYRDGNLMDGGVYVIQNFTAEDQGEYRCNCSNVAAVEEVNLTIVLYGKYDDSRLE